MGKLDNKVAIITGGAASIGKNITQELHAQGASVVIAARTAEKGQKLADELGDRAMYIQTDITDDAQLEKLVNAAVERFGSLDILVNNACSYDDDGAATTREMFLSTINTSAISAAILGEIARPHLVKSRGNIRQHRLYIRCLSTHWAMGLPSGKSHSQTLEQIPGGRIRAG
jgi:NAD(P)-dependent dehydrogenase (short-subunit alcohol dehydrogenase family)